MKLVWMALFSSVLVGCSTAPTAAPLSLVDQAKLNQHFVDVDNQIFTNQNQ
jgi:hypothetical protein